jgi:hypothetical protein
MRPFFGAISSPHQSEPHTYLPPFEIDVGPCAYDDLARPQPRLACSCFAVSRRIVWSSVSHSADFLDHISSVIWPANRSS